ncbi:uncharacterized protein LOC129761057 [Uranotaenia lowii]|uniref:uncharacterized protein LOC129761057 n=1 Tax=Uranotaenia lowii TaxID=190385 RepID=UPI00247A9F34|nr:uncharacterized protein LOC129761057 [Uranotaenia lowii]
MRRSQEFRWIKATYNKRRRRRIFPFRPIPEPRWKFAVSGDEHAARHRDLRIDLGRQVSKPTKADWAEAKRALRYLKETVELKLHLGGDSDELEGYADADWAYYDDALGKAFGACNGHTTVTALTSSSRNKCDSSSAVVNPHNPLRVGGLFRKKDGFLFSEPPKTPENSRSIKDILCTQQRECAMCWDVCNRNHQIRKENELAQRLLLSLSQMIRNESVVTADIEWTTPQELLQHQPQHPVVVPSPLAASENVERLSRIARDGANSSQVSRIIQALSQDSSSGSSEQSQQQSFHQCLVSWEISGGGLTGNLLTETAKAELSLWPNTKYHVHVTCRNKETDQLIRSPPLLIDTSEAIIVSLQGTTSTTTTTAPPTAPPSTSTTAAASPLRPLSINSVIEEIDVIQATSFTDDIEADDEDNSFDGHQNQPQRLENHHRHRLWPMYSADLPENSKEIVILGVFVALLAFVLIVLTVILLVRRKQDQIEDRELLIESEVLPKILHV